MKDSLRQQFERLASGWRNSMPRWPTGHREQHDALSRPHARARRSRFARHQFRQYEQRERDLATAREMLDEPDMAEMAQEEIGSAEADLTRLHAQLQAALLPRDPDDGRNAFLEIRAGTGGDESALFAADLLRMYLRHAERQGWRTEVMSESMSDLGGYKEVVLRVAGDDVYARLKFESGGHRVQRVPTTETQGRIHTSACTVAVMPEPDEAEEIQLNPADLRSTPSAPAALAASTSTDRQCHPRDGPSHRHRGGMPDDRSQHRNKARRWPCWPPAARQGPQRTRSERSCHAQGLIEVGDRSDRIRTYNFRRAPDRPPHQPHALQAASHNGTIWTNIRTAAGGARG